MRKWILVAFAALLFSAGQAEAAAIPYFTGSTGSNPANLPVATPDLNTLITNINNGVTPASMGTFANFRNLADNGAMEVNQRGASSINCGGTTGTGSAASLGAGYVADRWSCIVNVGSQAGKVQILTTTPPAGFLQYSQIIRNSGSLAQPICLLQEQETLDATHVQGQTIVLSAQMQALAGLAADNGSVVNFVLFTGTGTNQGLGSLTASPAITPAWTNISSPAIAATTITTSWARYQTAPIPIPAAATELAWGVCFTPTTTTSGGATDGVNITGFQSEVSSTVASSFEYKPYSYEQMRGYRTYFVVIEVATPQPPYPFNCFTANTPTFAVPFPVPMRGVPTTPTSGNSQVITAGGIKVSLNGAGVAGITGIAAGTHTANWGNITGTNSCAVATPTGGVNFTGTTGILPFSADF